MVADMWETRERPLLEAIAKADEKGHAVKRVSALFGTARGNGVIIGKN